MFKNPFRKNDAPDERKDPTMGAPQAEEGAPAPWEPVKSDSPGESAPPAFDVVKPSDAPDRGYDPYGIAEAEAREREAAAKARREAPVPPAPVPEEDLPGADPDLEEPAAAESGATPEEPDRDSEAPIPEPAVVREPVPRRTAVKRVPKPEPLPPSDEELLARRRTKHRLVGAAALLMAVVVAAPFVLDNEDDFAKSPLSTEIPEVSETQTKLDIPTVPAESEPKAPVPDVQKSGEASAAAKPAEKKAAAPKPSEGKPTEVKPTSKSERPAAKSEPSVGIEPPTGTGWYVQVMATSSEREAERAVKRLSLLGLPAYRMPVETRATTLWRVRAGLFKTKKEAEGVVGTIVLNGIASKPLVSRQ